MNTTYRKLYKFHTKALAEDWLIKKNPQDVYDFYIIDEDKFYYNVIEDKKLIPQSGVGAVTVSENGVAKGNTENIDFIDGDNTTFDVVKDLITGKIKVKVNASGGGGGIESIVEGTNITIDDTDPLNPIISASSSLFPNGREIVTESRDFRDSDIDKLLIIVGNDITLTMPDSIVFSEQLRTIGLKFLQGYTGCGYQPIHGFTTKVLQLPSDGEFITLITGEYLGKSSVGSIANMQVNSDDGIVTLNKYLYDKVNASGGSPAGSDTQIQYNNAGSFGADAGFFRNLSSNQTGIFNTYDLGGSIFTTTGFWNLNNASLMFSKLDADPSSNVIFRSDASELKATVSSSASGNTNALQVSQTNVIVGNLSGGNNTKITIDDVNEQITISNLPAYDDDTAAGVGGLTAGMVYMTTGSGSAPLNAAGILMIKQ